MSIQMILSLLAMAVRLVAAVILRQFLSWIQVVNAEIGGRDDLDVDLCHDQCVRGRMKEGFLPFEVSAAPYLHLPRDGFI